MTYEIQWFEAGFVPGSRICDTCGRFFQAMGSVNSVSKLVRDARFDRNWMFDPNWKEDEPR